MEKNIFTGVRAKWLPLYEQLKEQAQKRLGAFEEHETVSAVLWKHHTTFAEVSARAECLVVAFAAEEAHPEWEPKKTLQTSKRRVAHYFEVTDASRFPEFIERIAEAHALTQNTRAPQKREETPEYSTVDEYIALFPGEVRAILEKVRRTIREAAPEAEEKISWKMPTYYLGENLIHFAAAKTHIGIYPGENGVAAFKERFEGCKTTKGAIQLPLTKPIPYGMIGELTRFRVKEAQVRKKN